MRITERKISSVKPYKNNPRLNDNLFDVFIKEFKTEKSKIFCYI
jgi:hypothetical protein